MLKFLQLVDYQESENRRQLIHHVIKLQNTALKYEKRLTSCPICELYQQITALITCRTEGAVRFMRCPECDSRFKAVGERPKKKANKKPKK